MTRVIPRSGYKYCKGHSSASLATPIICHLFTLPLSVPNAQAMATIDIEMASPIGPVVPRGYDQDHAFGISVRLVAGSLNRSTLIVML